MKSTPMPGWFAPLLGLAAVAVVLSGLNLLKTKKVLKDSDTEER